MLQRTPLFIGRMLKKVRSDLTKLLYNDPVFRNVPEVLKITSPVFKDGGSLPVKYTADGKGVSPPLAWGHLPTQAKSVFFIMEDVDSPTHLPLTHAIVFNLPVGDCQLPEGALTDASLRKKYTLGRNSFLMTKYTPPDPPPGHGLHHYIFQFFALNTVLQVSGTPSRKEALELMRKHVLAKGYLAGTYKRG